MSTIQKLVVIDAFLFILHEWEEGHYPGGFVNLIASLVQINPSDEIKRASRIPAGILNQSEDEEFLVYDQAVVDLKRQ